MTGEQSTEPVLPTTTTTSRLLLLLSLAVPGLRRSARKRLIPRILVRILLPLVHLLLELLRFLLVCKTQPKHALLALEAEEEDAVLVVLEGVVEFLVP
jgi:hypothetical protein